MSIREMDFPKSDRVKSGFWRPVYFRPNLDTPERLVAGIITSLDGEWRLMTANALDRLKCLYGDEAAVASEVIEYGLEQIERALRAGDAAQDVESLVSGLQIGDKIEAQGLDVEELGLRWLRIISSLHSRRKEISLIERSIVTENVVIDKIDRNISSDRLSVLVMEQMAESAPQSRAMFSSHVHRLKKDQGARLLTHKAYVAFTGQKVAANFATLKPGRQKVAVDVSKRLMWDLEQHRDSEDSFIPRLSHEMILYHPSKDDPTITARQFDNVMDVVNTLEQEGQNRDIRVLSYVSVPEISGHILQVEGLEANNSRLQPR